MAFYWLVSHNRAVFCNIIRVARAHKTVDPDSWLHRAAGDPTFIKNLRSQVGITGDMALFEFEFKILS